MKVYTEYKVYGPYTRKDGRMHVVLVHNETKKKKTVSYPKFLVENDIGRYLTKDETVDHHDSDKTNNDLSNLKILSRKENAKKDAVRIDDIFVDCAWCGVNFKLRTSQRGKSVTSAGPFCSRSCTGKYGKSVQMGGSIESRNTFNRTYYKNSGADLTEKQKKKT